MTLDYEMDYWPSINALRKLGLKVEAQLRDYFKIDNEFIYTNFFQFYQKSIPLLIK